MKLSKTIMHAMLAAITTGTIVSCQKPKVDVFKKEAKSVKDSTLEKYNQAYPGSCPACGMG
jgi:hypothetical protein